MKTALTVVFCLLALMGYGQVTFQNVYWGVDKEDGYSVQQTTDGGYIIAGWTDNFGAGYNDVYVIKTNSAGDTLWTKTFGRIDYEYGYSVRQTSDGGYIISGISYSFVGLNVYLIKTDTAGTLLWSKNFGGANTDYGY